MSQFLKLVAYFLLPIVLVFGFLEVLLRNIPNDYAYKNNILKEKSDKIEVLFLGNSHAYFGINPVYIKRNSFNGAHISQSLDYDAAIIEKYKSNLNSLKVLIVPVDYFSLFANLENGVEKWRKKNYTIYYNITGKADFWSNFEIFNGKLLFNLSRAFTFLFHNKNNITCNNLGFGVTFKSTDSKDLIETGISSAKRHTIDVKDNNIFNSNIESINYLIDFTNKKGIKLIFITYPCFSSYTEKLSKPQLDKTINSMKTIVSSKKDVVYLNYLTDTTFQSKDFFDGDHLNEIGAKKLTIKLNSIIDSILVQN